MNNYKAMAFRYLKLNKKRTAVTIIGVTVAVTVLYAMLNLGWCGLLNEREKLREEQDYEIVFLTETEEQIAQIMADNRVRSASVGAYYQYNYYGSTMYENALYINTRNPYRMSSILEELRETYKVEGKLNSSLAATYMQGENGEGIFALIIFVLLISFIFAIFGVGIVRNSIQLSILEQIQDYGNLRCIGSTKSQIKQMIYIQGAVLELIGNGIGLVSGFIASLIIGYFLKWKVGFHLIPIVPVLVAFLGDLYFAMEENCKVIADLTPVAAIRGEYRIHKEKIKVRKRSIFGRIFGVEGDYAYKSIMRNPGRFHKTVWGLGIGMGAFMAVMGSTGTIKRYIKETEERYGYYQVYFENCLNTRENGDDIQSNLPSYEILEGLSKLEEVKESRCIYSAMVLLNDYEENLAHYRKDYLDNTYGGNSLKSIIEAKERGNGDVSLFSDLTELSCYGYAADEMENYKKVLKAGTLEVSENGIILVNGGMEREAEGGGFQFIEVEYTDYQVGDTIDIVDMGKFRSMMNERLVEMKKEYEKELAKLPVTEGEEQTNPMEETPKEKLEDDYFEKKNQALKECRDKLLAEGAYKTYTIEGIVSRDVNYCGGYPGPRIILPLDRYYSFTGTDETMVTGMRYHFDKFSPSRYESVVYGSDEVEYAYGEDVMQSAYPGYMSLMERFKICNRGLMLFVLFVVTMTTLNIINTTANNLHLRRKEFAQLRVIGVSQKGLMKMVMLEGVISSLVAALIGIVLGVLLSFISFGQMIIILFDANIYFPFWEAAVGVAGSTLIICGSIYMPLRTIRQNMAADLATGGD